MRKIIFFILLLLTLLPEAVLARPTLTLNEFIDTAVKNNPSYQVAAQDYIIALESDKGARSLDDWNLVSSGFWQGASPAPISAFSASYQKSVGYSLGLEKYFSNTGTALQLKHGNTRVEAQYPAAATAYNPASPYYLSNLSLTISQPLLKNAFGLAAKNGLKMSAYSVDLAELKLAKDWEDFITNLKKEYLAWQKCHHNLSLYKEKVETVKDQLNLVKQQQKYGLSEELDLVQLQQKATSYQILQEQAILACEIQTIKIVQMMRQENMATTTIEPADFTQSNPSLAEENALPYLIDNSILKKTLNIIVAIQTTNLETKKNNKLPDVNLVLQAKPNAYTHNFSDSLSKIGSYSEYTVSVSANQPIANNQALSAATQAEAEQQKALKEGEAVMLNAKIGLASLYASLNGMDKMLNLSQQNIDLAKKQLALEKKKFNQGRNSIFFILQAEDTLLQAENNYIETLFARAEIINQIEAFTDRYLIEYKEVLKI